MARRCVGRQVRLQQRQPPPGCGRLRVPDDHALGRVERGRRGVDLLQGEAHRQLAVEEVDVPAPQRPDPPARSPHDPSSRTGSRQCSRSAAASAELDALQVQVRAPDARALLTRERDDGAGVGGNVAKLGGRPSRGGMARQSGAGRPSRRATSPRSPCSPRGSSTPSWRGPCWRCQSVISIFWAAVNLRYFRGSLNESSSRSSCHPSLVAGRDWTPLRGASPHQSGSGECQRLHGGPLTRAG